MFLIEIQTYLLFIYLVQTFVFIPESIRPVPFGPGRTEPPKISIRRVFNIHYNAFIFLSECPSFISSKSQKLFVVINSEDNRV